MPVMNVEIRELIAEHARLAVEVRTLSDEDSLYEAGMTSHATVNLMLALENSFDTEFPDSMLTRSVFESVSSIAAALGELQRAA
jgi:acyl carrier protein